MLAGWTETHNSGAKVSFWLPNSEDLEPFKGLTAKKGNQAGQRFMAVLVEIGPGELPVVPEGCARSPVEPVANRAPEEKRPPYGEYAADLYRNGFFLAQQVLRAAGSPEAYRHWCVAQPCAFTKADGPSACHQEGDNPYFLVPIAKELDGVGEGIPFNEQRVMRERIRHLSRWIAQVLFHKVSMGHVPPEALRDWCNRHNLGAFLPKAYRSAVKAQH